ncbi:MAG: hypothetical protein IKB16_02935 [Lentisphaeria bacterium]|nr:hypothetical protein [Lentisphaeria bacterium]
MDEKQKIQFLIELIDDENEQSASLAMAELLKSPRQDLVKSHLCDLQEAENIRLRRRIHQLQTAISLRTVREELGKAIRNDAISLLQGAFHLHMLWFDTDDTEKLWSQWQELCAALLKHYPGNLTDIAKFMQEQKFRPVLHTDTLAPEQYCIGCALEKNPASALLLSIIAQGVTAQTGAGLRIIRSGFKIGVADIRGEIMLPLEDWRVISMEEKLESGMPWHYVSDSAALHTLTVNLFQCATVADSFRYMYTLGTVLAISAGKENLDFLPYPYHIK